MSINIERAAEALQSSLLNLPITAPLLWVLTIYIPLYEDAFYAQNFQMCYNNVSTGYMLHELN